MSHCVCVVGKLPLQNIQLSKNPPPQPLCRVGVAGPRLSPRCPPIPSSAAPGVARRQREPSRQRRLLSGLAVPLGSLLANLRRERSLGGEYRARTGDLLVANQALSQLS